MEVEHASNESTPLPGNDITSNEHRQLFRTFAFDEQMPLNENDTDFTGQAPLKGNGASNSDSRNSPREANEVSLKEVVFALGLAWKQIRQPKSKVTLEFTTKELQAMHLAWKDVTRERHCSLKPHIIAKSVAIFIAIFLLSELRLNDENVTDVYFKTLLETYKNLLTANILTRWREITMGVKFNVRYIKIIFGNSEQPLATSKFRLVGVKLYDKIRDFVLNPKLQVFLQVLLFFWPISILIIGSAYMECPMGHHLSRLLLFLGCVGCLAITFRLVLMNLTSQTYIPCLWIWEWIYLRLIEFTFLIVFIVQAFYFFDTDLTNEPDPSQCVQTFYNAAMVINYVSIAFLSAYVFAYIVSIYHKWLNIVPWIFRYIDI